MNKACVRRILDATCKISLKVVKERLSFLIESMLAVPLAALLVDTLRKKCNVHWCECSFGCQTTNQWNYNQHSIQVSGLF